MIFKLQNIGKYVHGMKVNIISLKSNAFPEVLRNIPVPPKKLYVLGDLETLLSRPRLAVVGSRKVSPYGRQITSALVQEVASRGVVIVSGLALGVDSIAHKAALDTGGLTIAVLPSHVTEIYPRSHTQLARRILEKGGALISEYPEGVPPQQYSFIARNRLVSGLSDGVLITEAAAKSGTLHTANFALEQGRTVMAVPGNVNSPMSAGTNNLIKAGATVVTEPSDVLQALGITEKLRNIELFANNEEESVILTALGQGITDSSELLIKTGLDAVQFNQTLTMLEITGRIVPLGAGHWRLR